MTNDIDNSVHNLMMSQTMQRLAQLAETMPTDIDNQDDLKTAFSTCGVDLIDALDNGRIHFDNETDKAMLYALLTVTTDYVLDGRLKTAGKARLN